MGADPHDTLEDYGKFLNVDLVKERLGFAIHREKELGVIEPFLTGTRRRSVLLVGPSGSGKTALLHELVRRHGARDSSSPEGWRFLLSSMSLMMAGTKYLGEWETRVQLLIETSREMKNLAVVLTDIHLLMTVGTTVHSKESVGTFLAPYIESGDVLLIGECTEDQLQQGFERHPSIRGMFHVVRVTELDREQSRDVLTRITQTRTSALREADGIDLLFQEPVLDQLFDLSHHFFPGRVYPGKSVQLLDQVISFFQSLRTEDPAALSGTTSVTQHHLISTLERFTGIPTLLLDDTIPLHLEETRRYFESRVLGQREAVDAVLDAITLIKAGVTDPEKPLGVFFFVGPTGVGKTELAKALADFIFGSSDRMVRFDMSEYKDYSSFEKLIGSSHAAAFSEPAGGTLTSKIRQQPFSVVLFDEIEKAHPNIFDLLLQVFDDGRLTDPRGETTNFTQTILIMTSNVGSEMTMAPSIGFLPEAQVQLEARINDAMRAFFRPEFLNRIDRTVVFQALNITDVRTLAQRELGKVLLRSGITRRNMRIDVDPQVIDVLIEHGFSPEFGARPLKRAVERLALLPVARQIVKMSPDTLAPLLHLGTSAGKIQVRIVQDAESRKASAVARGVELEDPLKKHKVRMKPGQIDERITALLGRVESLSEICRTDKLDERKSELVETTTRVDFWDDSARARRVLSEIHRLERMMDAIERVRKRAADLAAFTRLAAQNKDPNGLATAAQRLQDVEHHAEILRYSLCCRGEFEHCDAFLRITLIDHEPVGNEDVVGRLGEMYDSWSRSKGFSATVLHEESCTSAPDATRSLTLLLEGVSLYGILRGENGIHEMIQGKSGAQDKISRFVKVEVLPHFEGDEGLTLLPGELKIDERTARGPGRLVKRFRSKVSITHRPTLFAVYGRSAHTADEARPLLTDLLASLLWRRQNANQDDAERVIRRYTFSPRKSVRDLRTQVSTTRLDAVLAGSLDEFLQAEVEQRAPDPA